MIKAITNIIVNFLSKLATSVAIFFAGARYERNKRIEKENEDYENVIGFDDIHLANELRKRAKTKDKD